MAGGRPGHSRHEIKKVLRLRAVRRGLSRTAALGFQGADAGLFRGLADRAPGEAALEGPGLQAGRAFLRKEF